MVVALSSLAKILREGLTIHSSPALFFFLKGRSARAHQFQFLGQDQSRVDQRAETTESIVCSKVVSIVRPGHYKHEEL